MGICHGLESLFAGQQLGKVRLSFGIARAARRMTPRLALVLPLLIWAPANAALDVDFGRYHALVIGINDYQNLPRLETAVNDASAVADVLRQKYGFEVELLLNPTRDDIIRILDRLRSELTEKDNLLIYYAGHGVLDVEADAGSWLPVDSEEGTRTDWIPVSTVTGTVKAMSAKHVLVISDSCYSGTLTRGVIISTRPGAEREAELRRLSEKRSRTALVSGGLEPVSDGGGDGHSVFTRALLTALRANAEVLDGHRLFTAIRRPVIVNAEQTPRYADIRLAGHDGGDFLFVPVSAGVREGGGGQPPAVSVDMHVWDRIKDSANPVDFATFLETYPSSPMAAFARNRLEDREGTPGPVALAAPAAATAKAPGIGEDPTEPGSDATELAFWEWVEDTDQPRMIEAYLGAYPNGVFASLARRKLEVLDEALTSTRQRIGRFDGEWTGRAILSSGNVRYCAVSKWRLTIAGNRISGKTWRGATLEGTIDEMGRLTGTTYHPGTGWGSERASVKGAYGDGEINGTEAGERGVCRWNFTLTKG